MKLLWIACKIFLGFPLAVTGEPGLRVSLSAHKAPVNNVLNKREETYHSLELINEYTRYLATMKFGSSENEVRLLIDTGSSLSWVLSDTTLLRGEAVGDLDEANQLITNGIFDTKSSRSLTLDVNNPKLKSIYLDGDVFEGRSATDNIKMGDCLVKDFKFAVAVSTTMDTGILGLACPEFETKYQQKEFEENFDIFPKRLKSSGIIKKMVYSVFLDRLESDEGSLLFGAVDHAKYHDYLQTVPMLKLKSRKFDSDSMHIELSSIFCQTEEEKIPLSTAPIPVTLDTGATMTFLPKEVAERFAALFGAQKGRNNLYIVDCEETEDITEIVFDFSGAIIRVPRREVVFRFDKNSCYLGIMDLESNGSEMQRGVLGVNFLRNAYVVFDLEDREISLGQADHTPGEYVEEIVKKVPLADRAPHYARQQIR